MGPRGLKFVNEIGRKIQEKTGNKNAKSHIIQAISMKLSKEEVLPVLWALLDQ